MPAWKNATGILCGTRQIRSWSFGSRPARLHWPARTIRRAVSKPCGRKKEGFARAYLTIPELFCFRKIHKRGNQKLNSWKFTGNPHALKLTLFAAAGFEREQILIVEMGCNLVEIASERHWSFESKVIGFRAGFRRKLAQLGLRVRNAEKSAAGVTRVGSVQSPDINVSLLRALHRRVQVGGSWAEISAEVIDTGRNEQYGAAFAVSGKAFDQVLQRQIWTGEGAKSSEGNAQGFGGKIMILGEILGDHGGAVAAVKKADVGRRRLRMEKRANIAPLRSDALVQRVVDQHSKKKRLSTAPVGDL